MLRTRASCQNQLELVKNGLLKISTRKEGRKLGLERDGAIFFLSTSLERNRGLFFFFFFVEISTFQFVTAELLRHPCSSDPGFWDVAPPPTRGEAQHGDWSVLRTGTQYSVGFSAVQTLYPRSANIGGARLAAGVFEP